MNRPLRQLPAMIFGFVMGATVSAMAGGPAPSTAVSMLLLQAQDEINAITSLAHYVPDPNLRARLESRANRAEAAVDQALVQSGHIGGRPPGGPIHGHVVVVTSDAEMASILYAIGQANFSADRLAVLRSATQGRPFTAAQVGQLIDAMTFSDEQVQAGAMLYPQVVDPQNWFTVYSHLTFSSDRAELSGLTDGR